MKLDETAGPAIDIYDNAMFLIALEDFMEIEENLFSPIPFERMITDTHLISPNFLQNINKLGKKVEYVKNFKERKNALVEVIYGKDNRYRSWNN